jgi:hypothetical protein
MGPAAVAVSRMPGGASTVTTFRVQPSCAALPGRDGAGGRRAAAALTVTGVAAQGVARRFRVGVFFARRMPAMPLPDPAPLPGVGVVITGRHVGGLLAIVARVKPIAVIVAVESSRHSLRCRLPG